MRYSQMTDEQRGQLFDEPGHYPLRVAFLGKMGLLSAGEIAFLLEHAVDFDVDDHQMAMIFARLQRANQPAPGEI